MSNSKTEEKIDLSIRQTWHKISRMYNQKAAQANLTISIGFILLIVDKEGTPSTQIGPRMGMEPTSLSRTLKTMEERGYIRRQADKIDKRKVFIFLTDAGVQQRREVRDIVLAFNEKLRSKIPKGKLKVFFEVMAKIETTVDDELEKIFLSF
ncbi:MAG: MarR family winged helix-turn-helix transcriptional regulator [Lishizhenia sp.]